MLGWFGNILIVVGLWGVGNRQRRAFLFSIAGEAVWVLHAANQQLWDLASVCVVFLVMAIRGYIKWGQ